MAEMVAIMGETGHGKSHSIKYLNPDETIIINAYKKSLPFKGWKNLYNSEKKNYAITSKARDIIEALDKINKNEAYKNVKHLVIDTLSAVMWDDEMSRMKEKGYDKWIDLAYSIYGILDKCISLRNDLIVFCMFHTQDLLDEMGNHFYRIQTSGQKLQKIKIESRFPIVLHAKCQYGDTGNENFFETQANYSTAKSPEGMFETKRIPNNLQLAADAIRAYNQ